ncbi:alkaline phosphatase D family protein [Pyxidicoccus xibeiensis]|uniref:alkaline phosphatase D family protein n=1 Tax=Pyxidicoccus xibeiensis TaxID=2906759 RepID=UPI0020A75286|nr:alkaline phosphatase D family protein [Pyxidicoccus xibeiensis]MCP3138072.1 alkaline phosphatase family protein [Pyxidicoccus xibeiensis]
MMKRSVPGMLLGVWVASGLVVPGVAQAHEAPLVRAPMVGRTWTTGASIWAGTSVNFGDAAGEKLVLRAREASACATCWVSTTDMTEAGSGGGFRSWKGTVDGLKANTRYDYRIFVAGQAAERGGVSFKTEPNAGARFKVGVASCMNGEKNPSQPSFDIMHEQLDTGEANIQLLVGDNMYTTQTPPNKEHYWFKYFQQRNVPEFARVFRAFPTFAVWDDHDYGPNDEDGTFAQKDVARDTYAALFPHPPFAGGGIFHKFTWSDVEFFMMDDRWGRDCPRSMPAGYSPQMYGADQFSWLKSSLAASTATFKVIVNGSTLNSECWGNQRQALFNHIADKKIGGVLFVTGDIHKSQLTSRTPGVGYTVWELTSSGIGVGADPAEYSFGIMEFNTNLDDPTVTFKVINNPQRRSSINGAGVTVSTRTVKRSALRP